MNNRIESETPLQKIVKQVKRSHAQPARRLPDGSLAYDIEGLFEADNEREEAEIRSSKKIIAGSVLPSSWLIKIDDDCAYAGHLGDAFLDAQEAYDGIPDIDSGLPE